MKFVCFHLYNDFSGSPRVLKQVVERWLQEGREVDLVTSRNGILSTVGGRSTVNSQQSTVNGQLVFRYYNYKFSKSGVVTLLRYAWVQVYTFFVALGYWNRDVEFYINTILPVGPAVAGWLMRKRVVYHYHENAREKGRVYMALAWVMQKIASEIICVSEYQRAGLKRETGCRVVPNEVDRELAAQAVKVSAEEARARRCVLMLCSLKRYKGVNEFVELAQRLKEVTFVMVVNDTMENIERYFEEYGLAKGANLEVWPRQENVAPFYNRASLVLNLTDKNYAVETFGLTVVEAQAFGLPVIVPTVGGIAEMVEDGVNGWKVDVQELDVIAMRIDEALSDRTVYVRLAEGAVAQAGRYSQ